MTVVQTKLGKIRGIRYPNYDVFKGIPFAQPPIDTQRFCHAQPITSCWTGELDATCFGSVPLQPMNTLESFFSVRDILPVQDEDCLTLNIWRPSNHKTNTQLPVIFYIYGGSFVNGHSAQDLYQPDMIVQQEDVIVVTCNYRIGALGFLDWSAINPSWDSNNGLSDLICALQWIHTHIAAFGGDPTHITLMGQSAGAMSIQALLQLPSVQLYVHNAVMLSGILEPDTAQYAKQKAYEFQALKQNLAPNTPWESLTSETLLLLMSEHQAQYGKSKGLEMLYQPITTHNMPIKMNAPLPCPIWIGVTTAEGDIYIKNEQKIIPPKQFQYVLERTGRKIPPIHNITTAQQQRNFITTYYFHEPFHTYVKALSQHTTVYTYTFDWSHPTHPLYHSAYHILDVLFWFGRLDIIEAQGAIITEHERCLSQNMIHDLCAFARTSHLPYSHIIYQ
ncbi:carboxylesterase family protein [Staphylococcus americanisciuri]|uniref:Carboxylic ester hydrolase n=1 Tax=Staphylococcus americanisciuri TaxID=2973940 RepID=A0ABT2EZV5_9STAP|nr:carboxylesterase family protein [Staphylococcus americanisciuri]MCS4485739.1 carboxylesterase family protein [Staphylococcus americanisciuri]